MSVFLLSDPQIKLTQLYGLRFAFVEGSAVDSTSAVNSTSAVIARTSFRDVRRILKTPSLDSRTPAAIRGVTERYFLIGISHSRAPFVKFFRDSHRLDQASATFSV